MEPTKTDLMRKAITKLNETVALAAAIEAATGQDVLDEQAQMKIMASKCFAEMLFDEEIVIDKERGFMFKSDAERAPESVC